MSVEILEIIIPSNPADRQDILRNFDEISNALVRVAGERDFIKETIAAISEKYDLPKKVLNKLAKIHQMQNIDAVQYESEAIIDSYRIIAGKPE